MSENKDLRIVSREEITLEAARDNLDEIMAFVEDQLEATDILLRDQMKLMVSIEEIFVNIATYAYKPGTGEVSVIFERCEEPAEVRITFVDQGVPYDPLAKEDPDITLPAEKRQIGGLGIFMVKKSVDDMVYEYRDHCNILTLIKAIG